MDVKEIKKIDIHAYAALIYDFFPPLYRRGQALKWVSAEQLIELYDGL